MAMSMGEVLITETAVGELAGVRVGVHSIWNDEWTDDRGYSRRGPRATLAVMGDDEDDFDLRVHLGSTLTVSGRTFRVTHIDAPESGLGAVTILEVAG